MKTIWKFECPIADEVVIHMPLGSQILCVQMQHNVPCIWALVDDAMPKLIHNFAWRGTGHPCDNLKPRHHESEPRYIGTVQMHNGSLVFHLFEVSI